MSIIGSSLLKKEGIDGNILYKILYFLALGFKHTDIPIDLFHLEYSVRGEAHNVFLSHAKRKFSMVLVLVTPDFSNKLIMSAPLTFSYVARYKCCHCISYVETL